MWERWQVCQHCGKKSLMWKGSVEQWQDSPITKRVHNERELFHRQHVLKQWGSNDSCEKDDKFVNFVTRNHYCQRELLIISCISLNEFIVNEKCFIVNMYRVGIQKFIKYLLQYHSKNPKKYWNKGQKYCYLFEFIVDKSKLQND